MNPFSDTGEIALMSFFMGYMEDLRDDFKDIAHVTESPIEEIMLANLLSQGKLLVDEVILKSTDNEIYFGNGIGWDRLLIEIQHQEGKHRVDFKLTYFENKDSKSVFLECDGHDYHARTKEQAARDKQRDRDLQKIYPVLRFTGSEIFKAPHDCAYQAINFIMGRS